MIGIASILTIFSFVMGIEKMLKIIIGNYILMAISLAASESLQLLVQILNQNPDLKSFGILHSKLAHFLNLGHTTFVLILYAALLVLIYLKSKFYVRLPEDPGIQKALYIILVPMTVMSIILTLQVVLMGNQILDISQLTQLVQQISDNNYLSKFFSFTPLWIVIHGILTILITTEFKISQEPLPKI